MSSPFARRHRQELHVINAHRTAQYLVTGMTGQCVGQCGLTGAVRSHDHVDSPVLIKRSKPLRTSLPATSTRSPSHYQVEVTGVP